MRRVRFAFGIMLASLVGCGDDDSPSALILEQPLVLHLVLENIDGSATIREVVFSLDQTELATVVPEQPAQSARSDASLIVGVGTHTVSALIVDQTGTENDYRLSADGTWAGGNPQSFGSATGAVGSGGVIEFSIRLGV